MAESAGDETTAPEAELTPAQRRLMQDLSDEELNTLSQISAGLRAARSARSTDPQTAAADSTGVFYY